jgi:hypothetical protein
MVNFFIALFSFLVCGENSSLCPQPLPKSLCLPMSTFFVGWNKFFPLSTAPPQVSMLASVHFSLLADLERILPSVHSPSPSHHACLCPLFFVCWLDLERILPSNPSPSPMPATVHFSLLAGIIENSSLCPQPLPKSPCLPLSTFLCWWI